MRLRVLSGARRRRERSRSPTRSPRERTNVTMQFRPHTAQYIGPISLYGVPRRSNPSYRNPSQCCVHRKLWLIFSQRHTSSSSTTTLALCQPCIGARSDQPECKSRQPCLVEHSLVAAHRKARLVLSCATAEAQGPRANQPFRAVRSLPPPVTRVNHQRQGGTSCQLRLCNCTHRMAIGSSAAN